VAIDSCETDDVRSGTVNCSPRLCMPTTNRLTPSPCATINSTGSRLCNCAKPMMIGKLVWRKLRHVPCVIRARLGAPANETDGI
jgi:hypothetical protein